MISQIMEALVKDSFLFRGLVQVDTLSLKPLFIKIPGIGHPPQTFVVKAAFYYSSSLPLE